MFSEEASISPERLQGSDGGSEGQASSCILRL